jgi:hypothetical protein
MTSSPRDAGIPVLTEIIDLVTPPAGAEAELPTGVEPALLAEPVEPVEPQVSAAHSASTLQTPVQTSSTAVPVTPVAEEPELHAVRAASTAVSASTLQPLAGAPASTATLPLPSLADDLARRAKPLFPTRGRQAPPAVRLPTLQSAEEAEAEAVATWTPEQWNRMELALRERILNQILLRVDAVLDARVRDALADVLQASVTRMADDLRASLKVSLADTIERAVQQEISRLQNLK